MPAFSLLAVNFGLQLLSCQLREMRRQKSSKSSKNVNCQNLYEVEQIRARKRIGEDLFYLVKWKFWNNPEDLTWQPKSNLLSVQDLIDQFERKNAVSEMPTFTQKAANYKIEAAQPYKKHSKKIKVFDLTREQISSIKTEHVQCDSVSEGMTIGEINYVIVDKDNIFYDVDLHDKEGRCVGVRKMGESEVKKIDGQKLMRYLEEYLVNELQQERSL